MLPTIENLFEKIFEKSLKKIPDVQAIDQSENTTCSCIIQDLTLIYDSISDMELDNFFQIKATNNKFYNLIKKIKEKTDETSSEQEKTLCDVLNEIENIRDKINRSIKFYQERVLELYEKELYQIYLKMTSLTYSGEDVLIIIESLRKKIQVLKVRLNIEITSLQDEIARLKTLLKPFVEQEGELQDFAKCLEKEIDHNVLKLGKYQEYLNLLLRSTIDNDESTSYFKMLELVINRMFRGNKEDFFLKDLRFFKGLVWDMKVITIHELLVELDYSNKERSGSQQKFLDEINEITEYKKVLLQSLKNFLQENSDSFELLDLVQCPTKDQQDQQSRVETWFNAVLKEIKEEGSKKDQIKSFGGKYQMIKDTDVELERIIMTCEAKAMIKIQTRVLENFNKQLYKSELIRKSIESLKSIEILLGNITEQFMLHNSTKTGHFYDEENKTIGEYNRSFNVIIEKTKNILIRIGSYIFDPIIFLFSRIKNQFFSNQVKKCNSHLNKQKNSSDYQNVTLESTPDSQPESTATYLPTSQAINNSTTLPAIIEDVVVAKQESNRDLQNK